MAEGTLNLRMVEAAQQGASYDVVARVQPVSAEVSAGGTTRDLVVAAQRPDGTTVSLEPGYYSVRLFLPSGRVLQQSCEVSEGGESSLVFEAPAAANTPFSLQESTGTASLSKLLDDAVTASADRAASARPSRTDRTSTGKPPRRAPRKSASGRKKTVAPRRTHETGLVTSFSMKSAGSRPKARSFRSSAPKAETELKLSAPGAFAGPAAWSELGAPAGGWSKAKGWTRVDASEARETASIWRLQSHNDDPARRWALVSTPKALELVSLPMPWRCVRTRELSPVDVLVDATLGGRAASTLAIHDEALDGLLSYLDRGRLTALRPMMDGLESEGLIAQTIYDKTANPLAACAAAYVGLAVFDTGEPEQWDEWLANIMRRFAWLPDGGILHARRIMLRPRHPAERSEILPAIKRSIAAGIPCYSAGLQLLREMLVVLLEEEEEAEGLLEKVAPVVARSDPRQLFTILRYPGASA